MLRIRTLIADDEPPARRRLAELLGQAPDVEIVAEAANGRETAEAIRQHTPDLLFLDIEMPEADGFAALSGPEASATPVTIFVTAYDRYAVRAFEARAIDYLLKPYSDERFAAALDHARERLAERALSTGSRFAERIVVKSRGRARPIDVETIDWIEAAGVYVVLHAGTEEHLYRSTLGRLLERLDPARFARVHRSAAVNLRRIRELRSLGHGETAIRLASGRELRLSRAYRASIEGRLEG